MKKTILIIVSCIMLLTFIVLPTSAESEVVTPTAYFVFKETQKVYPLYASIDNVVGFIDYYGVDIDNIQENKYTFVSSYDSIPVISKELSIVFYDNGFGDISYYLKDNQYHTESNKFIEGGYTDFGFYIGKCLNSGSPNDCQIVLVGIKDGEKTVINTDMFTTYPGNINYPPNYMHSELPDGYYIENKDQNEDNNEEFIVIAVKSIVTLIVGLSSAILCSFESLFIINGMLTNIAIFILSLVGFSIVCYVIRLIFKIKERKGE